MKCHFCFALCWLKIYLIRIPGLQYLIQENLDAQLYRQEMLASAICGSKYYYVWVWTSYHFRFFSVRFQGMMTHFSFKLLTISTNWMASSYQSTSTSSNHHSLCLNRCFEENDQRIWFWHLFEAHFFLCSYWRRLNYS